MTKRALQIAAIGAALVVATQAHAAMYDIYFNGPGNAVDAAVTVTVNASGIVTSGTLTIEPGATIGSVGTYTLLTPAGTIPFVWDNQLIGLPGGPNPTSPYFLDAQGLAFTGGGKDVRMYATGLAGTAYEVEIVNGNSVKGGAYITPVPEPTTLAAAAMLLVPFGASTFRGWRRHRHV